MIITGGTPSDAYSVSVEVFNPQTRHSCSLNDLPPQTGCGFRCTQERYGHTHCGQMLCGGGRASSTVRSCLKLNPLTGDFNYTSDSVRLLVEERHNHLCWAVEGEGGPTLLMGGRSSPNTTELLSSDGSSSSSSFPLQYNTT